MKNKTTKIIKGRRKRLGRGYGSGKGGHTVGKGQKGQKTRRRLGVMFEGVKVKKSLIKRLPFLRGKGKFASSVKPVAVNLSVLQDFPQGSIVDRDFLVEKGIVKKTDALKRGVKILGNFKIGKKLVVKLPVSKSSLERIVAAGGKVE